MLWKFFAALNRPVYYSTSLYFSTIHINDFKNAQGFVTTNTHHVYSKQFHVFVFLTTTLSFATVTNLSISPHPFAQSFLKRIQHQPKLFSKIYTIFLYIYIFCSNVSQT